MPETLLEIMQKEQCDLLVCGHHHSFINRLLKNKSDNKLYKLTKNIQWPKTKLRIERGEMPETLLEIMHKEKCDLLVCGHHHSFINRLMPAYRGMINKMSADLLIEPFIDK